MNIIPYVCTRDGWSIDDDVMRILWYRMLNEGIHQMVFYDGKIMDSDTWIAFAKSPGIVMHVVQLENKGPGMIAWLTDFGPTSACCHFLTYKDAAPNRIEMARKTIEYWFGWHRDNGEPQIYTLCGRTPDNNRAARLFLRKIGWKVLGIIPDMTYDAYQEKRVGLVISYINREEWQNGRE